MGSGIKLIILLTGITLFINRVSMTRLNYLKLNKSGMENLAGLVQVQNFTFEFFKTIENRTAIEDVNSEAKETNEVGRELCIDHLKYIINGIKDKDVWALKFFDAWGKFPSGVLAGHIVEMGNFEECLSIVNHNLTGKYCMAINPVMTQKQDNPMAQISNSKIGICVPASCNAYVIDGIMKDFWHGLFNISVYDTTIVKEENCVKAVRDPLRVIDWVAIAIFSFIGLLMTLSTLYDYWMPNNGNLVSTLCLAFSIRLNIRILFRMNSNKDSPHLIGCLHGIRFFSIVWVIFGHSYMLMGMSPQINTFDITEWFHSPFSMFVRSGVVSVDSFFFLSGLLLAVVTFREMERSSGKLNVPLMCIHRYIRLTPVVALAILFYVSLYQYTASGPLWNEYLKPTYLCRDAWWTTLLYVQNYASANKMCLGHTWYLAVDMQLYVISLLVLIAIWKWRSKGLAGLVIVGLLLCACLFTTIVVGDLNVFFGNGLNANDEMRKIYYSTHSRVSPWIVGIILGYFLHFGQNKRTTVCKKLAALCWVISLLIFAVTIFGLYAAQFPSALTGAFYLTLTRVAWPAALAWIVFACVNGYGGLVNTFLSWSFWQPCSRLTYCMYISHLIIATINAGRIKVSAHFSNYDVILRFWGDFCLTILISALMFISIEQPVMKITTILFPHKKRDTAPTVHSADLHVTSTVAATESKQNLCEEPFQLRL